MLHAFPKDELKPLSCSGQARACCHAPAARRRRRPPARRRGKHAAALQDTLGSYALTLIDALDSVALMGNTTAFGSAVNWLTASLSFDIDDTVSVFETNIRVLGGLMSAHLLAADEATGFAARTPSADPRPAPRPVLKPCAACPSGQVPGYKGGLLDLAADLGSRLLPAFDTPTGIPYGAVNLNSGVAEAGRPPPSRQACAGGAPRPPRAAQSVPKPAQNPAGARPDPRGRARAA